MEITLLIGFVAGGAVAWYLTRTWMKELIDLAKFEGQMEGFDRGCKAMVKDTMESALAAGADPELMIGRNLQKLETLGVSISEK